jgi:hypothetical protein
MLVVQPETQSWFSHSGVVAGQSMFVVHSAAVHTPVGEHTLPSSQPRMSSIPSDAH